MFDTLTLSEIDIIINGLRLARNRNGLLQSAYERKLTAEMLQQAFVRKKQLLEIANNKYLTSQKVCYA